MGRVRYAAVWPRSLSSQRLRLAGFCLIETFHIQRRPKNLSAGHSGERACAGNPGYRARRRARVHQETNHLRPGADEAHCPQRARDGRGAGFGCCPTTTVESRRSRQHLSPGTGQVAGAPRTKAHKTTVRQPNPSNNGRIARSVRGGIEAPLSGRAKPSLPGIRLYRISLHPSRARSDDLQSPMFNLLRAI